MLKLTAVNNSEDLSLTDKSVDLQAQCDEKESELTEELKMIDTFRKRQRNEMKSQLSQHLKRV